MGHKQLLEEVNSMPENCIWRFPVGRERIRRISEEPMKAPSLERSRSYRSTMEEARMSDLSSSVKKAFLRSHASLLISLPNPSAFPKRWIT